MAIFVTLSEGPDPNSIQPVLVTRDSRIVSAVQRELDAILGGNLDRPKLTDLTKRRAEEPARD